MKKSVFFFPRPIPFHYWTYPAPLSQKMLMKQLSEWAALLTAILTSLKCITFIRNGMFLIWEMHAWRFKYGSSSLVVRSRWHFSPSSYRERNIQYAELCHNRMYNNMNVQRFVQIGREASKNKQIQSDDIIMVNKGKVYLSFYHMITFEWKLHRYDNQ